MSGKNTSSKSGSKSCGSPDEYYEDELVTWLQYPLEDSLEKGYCSDLFGQWQPAASGSATVSRSPPDAMTFKAASGTGLCTDVGALSRLEGAQASTEAETSKDRMGNGPLPRTTSAEGALALGAERAAGLASQWGRDAFSKVRTSFQPPAGSHLTGRSDQLVQSDWMAVPMGGLTSKPSSALGPNILPRPPQSFAGFSALMSDSPASSGKGTVPQPMSFTAYKPRYGLPDALLQIPSAQESGCSRITEGQKASDYSSSASSRAILCSGQGSGTMPARFSPAPMDANGERTIGAVEASEMVLASSSGPSLSGTTLSTREASSYSGKRRCEESESQSVHMQDVDVESSMDVKQPRKTSKRNRAAEVHNLSERNRRNRINEKLRALQDLIPNSSKTDKASVLDEAIEYMKTLQMQLQMVSMRSGMNVSPMMIPVGMPHLQMAPLHPVGLGVPIGHPGMHMGMGMHMSVGMGMMEMPQGMMTRPPQSMSSATNQFSVPYQSRTITGSQDSSLDSTNIGSTASQFMPAAQITPQPFGLMPPVSHSLPRTHTLRQQQESWPHSGEHAYNVEAMEQCNDKVGGEE